MTPDLSAKRLALLREAVPSLSSVALFVDPKLLNSARSRTMKLLQRRSGFRFVWSKSRCLTPSKPAFAQAQIDHMDGAVAAGPMLFNERARVGAAAVAHKMPTISPVAEMVPYGLLMSYGPDLPDYFRRAAGYADKILRGAKPADLPVEQPTRLKQVINLKAANALGLTIPQSMLITTDEMIE